MGGNFYYSMANLNTLGFIEERGTCGIEMRIHWWNDESVSYAPPRVHFYIGDFGYQGGYFSMAMLTISVMATTTACQH